MTESVEERRTRILAAVARRDTAKRIQPDRLRFEAAQRADLLAALPDSPLDMEWTPT